MEATLFTTLTHCALFLAAIIAFVVWGFSGFPFFTITIKR